MRDNGGHAVALTWSMPNVFGIDAGDVFWAASDVGWVVGHSYIVYAPLLAGATSILYEGKPVGTPDAGAFWRVVERAPGQRALHGSDRVPRDPEGGSPGGAPGRARRLEPAHAVPRRGAARPRHLRLGHRRAAASRSSTTGGRRRPAGRSAANLRGLEPMPIKPGSPSVPVPGYDVQVLDGGRRPVGPGVEGAICLSLPLPPGTLPTLWNDDERYVTCYLSAYPGYYLTGDGGLKDEDGYVFVMGRTDDVINVAGHRLSTGSMEAVLAAHPRSRSARSIGVHDDLKGQVPRGFVVLKAGVDADRARDRRQSSCSRARPDRRRGRAAAGRHRPGAAQDAVGQDPAQDDAGDRRRRLATRSPAPSRTPACSTP